LPLVGLPNLGLEREKPIFASLFCLSAGSIIEANNRKIFFPIEEFFSELDENCASKPAAGLAILFFFDEVRKGRLDGWMDGWTDGRGDGWTDGRGELEYLMSQNRRNS
jgi:hypothetical protein